MLFRSLLMGGQEFERSLDAFPLEFGAILADYLVVHGPDPFEGLRVDSHDLRRACEVQARSHLLHLRQGYVEAAGRSDALAELIGHSAPSMAALLRNLGRLSGPAPADATLARVAQMGGEASVSGDEARRLFSDYLRAVEHLTATVDRWSES